MIDPKISVIIPVKNGAATLDKCLSAIRAQNVKDIEIIILDSMSDDNSRDIASIYNAKIISVPNGEFNHGLTRNLGVEAASGDLLFFTVQDAWIADDEMLERMSQHFVDDKVMGVVGHQAIPWGDADKNPAYWYKRYSDYEIVVRHFPENIFKKFSKREKFNLSGWDNVVAMYRRSALLETPFTETDFSEDWLWALESLSKGYKLINDTSVMVYHYHHLSFLYRFKSLFIVNYNFYKFFSVKPAFAFSPMKFLRATYTILKRKEIPAFRKPYWLMHNLGINLADFISIIIFRGSIFFGGDALLNKSYDVFCKRIPQGKLKMINEN